MSKHNFSSIFSSNYVIFKDLTWKDHENPGQYEGHLEINALLQVGFQVFHENTKK